MCSYQSDSVTEVAMLSEVFDRIVGHQCYLLSDINFSKPVLLVERWLLISTENIRGESLRVLATSNQHLLLHYIESLLEKVDGACGRRNYFICSRIRQFDFFLRPVLSLLRYGLLLLGIFSGRACHPAERMLHLGSLIARFAGTFPVIFRHLTRHDNRLWHLVTISRFYFNIVILLGVTVFGVGELNRLRQHIARVFLHLYQFVDVEFVGIAREGSDPVELGIVDQQHDVLTAINGTF